MRLREFAKSIMLVTLTMGCGDDPPTNVRDTTPPARITDLAVGSGVGGYFLSWTAPGDDDTTGTVSDYDIRYIKGDVTSQWDDAISLPSPESPVPAGQTQIAAFDSLAPGVWQFGVKAADEIPNWSDLSNVASLTISTAPTDIIPPAPVTDLTAEVTPEGVKLRWTAPGDDDQSGMATVYDLRHSLDMITPESFASAIAVGGVGSPKASGQPESVTVSELQGGHEYFFALKSADDVGNLSDISNVATAQLPLTAPRQLTFNSTPSGASNPHWSPDGSSIACSWGVPGGFGHVYQIFVVPLNGGSPERYTFSSYQAQTPAWSPDGSHFALAEQDADESGNRLAVMEATPRAAITVLASHSGLSVSRPQWSPDGTRIAYRALGGTPPNIMTTLYSISSDGGTPTSLAGPISNTTLTWSPDGTSIAFDSNQGGTREIWIMPSTGGAATQLTTGVGGKFSPSWSPDGAVIAYVQIASGQTSGQIWGIAPTGGPSFLLVDETGVLSSGLAWSPDGQKIAYVKPSPSNIWVAPIRAQP
jgi:Tol biopolymer transport system component